MTTYNDAYLDYWADIYVQNDIKDSDYTLLQFLHDPITILQRLILRNNNVKTPEQQAVNTVNEKVFSKMTVINDCLLKLNEIGFKITNVVQSDLSRNAVIWIRPNRHCHDLDTTSTVSGLDENGKYRVMVCTQFAGCQVQWYDRRRAH